MRDPRDRAALEHCECRIIGHGVESPLPASVMIGDDIETDIGGALDAGLRAVLVRTGKYRADVVETSGIEPTAIVGSIADVPALIRTER